MGIETKLSRSLIETIIDSSPNQYWMKWAAFDKPDDNGRCALKFFKNKPKLRKGCWYSDPITNFTMSTQRSFHTVDLEGFDWSQTLTNIGRYCTSEYRYAHKRAKELRKEIDSLEAILNIRKDQLVQCENTMYKIMDRRMS